jgi:hypothetical protein
MSLVRVIGNGGRRRHSEPDRTSEETQRHLVGQLVAVVSKLQAEVSSDVFVRVWQYCDRVEELVGEIRRTENG